MFGGGLEDQRFKNCTAVSWGIFEPYARHRNRYIIVIITITCVILHNKNANKTPPNKMKSILCFSICNAYPSLKAVGCQWRAGVVTSSTSPPLKDFATLIGNWLQYKLLSCSFKASLFLLIFFLLFLLIFLLLLLLPSPLLPPFPLLQTYGPLILDPAAQNIYFVAWSLYLFGFGRGIEDFAQDHCAIFESLILDPATTNLYLFEFLYKLFGGGIEDQRFKDCTVVFRKIFDPPPKTKNI